MFGIIFTGVVLFAFLASLILFLVARSRAQRIFRGLEHQCESLSVRLEAAKNGWAHESEVNEQLETKLEASYILLKQAHTLLKTMYALRMSKELRRDLANWMDAVLDVVGESEDGEILVADEKGI